MAAKDPRCQDDSDPCCAKPWDENSLVQRNAELPSILMCPDDIVLVGGNPGTKQDVQFTTTVDMLWTGSVARRTGNFRESIKLKWENESIDNGPVRDYLFWGQPGQPSRHAPKFLPRNKTMTISIEDLSGIANTVRLGFLGFEIPPELVEKYAKEFGKGRGLMRFSNQSTGDVIKANNSAGPIIQLEDHTHFRHDATCADSTSAEYEGLFSFRDVRGVQRQSSSNKRAHSSLWTGCVKGASPASVTLAGSPCILPSPNLMQAGSTVNFDLFDKSGADNTWFVTLLGAREQNCAAVGQPAKKCV